jgi:hypothetical protein
MLKIFVGWSGEPVALTNVRGIIGASGSSVKWLERQPAKFSSDCDFS